IKAGDVLGELETLSLLIACLCHDLDHRGGNQILSHQSPEEYMNVIHFLEDAILATDLTAYIKRQFTFTQMAKRGNYNWKREDNRELLRGMLMTACDIAAITKPWEIQKKGNMVKTNDNKRNARILSESFASLIRHVAASLTIEMQAI
ncbi:cGMP-specific 3',5'-cyclic phosphodiesterase, partial [Caerostris extrusa]